MAKGNDLSAGDLSFEVEEGADSLQLTADRNMGRLAEAGRFCFH